MAWMFVSPQEFICGNPWVELSWEAFMPLYEETGESLLPLFALPYEDMKRCCLQTRKRTLSRKRIGTRLSWTSQPSELQEINICCLRHPIYGIFFTTAYTDKESTFAVRTRKSQSCFTLSLCPHPNSTKPGKCHILSLSFYNGFLSTQKADYSCI